MRTVYISRREEWAQARVKSGRTRGRMPWPPDKGEKGGQSRGGGAGQGIWNRDRRKGDFEVG